MKFFTHSIKNYSICFLLIILFSNCNSPNQKVENNNTDLKKEEFNTEKEKAAIEKLIRQVIVLGESDTSLKIAPLVGDSLNRPVGFDFKQVEQNLIKLKQNGMFAKEFLDNYVKIIRTLDTKIKNKEFGDDWYINELPMFSFASGWDPWCCCQGYIVEQLEGIEIIKLDNKSGELKFKWSKDSDWKNFRFNVVKENNQWKISYLEGFDYENSIK